MGASSPSVQQAAASREMPLSEAEKWLDHLGSCSPCYADFKRLQEEHEARRRRMVLAVAAGILLTVAVTGWAVLHKGSGNVSAHTVVLDLRDRSISRGTETNQAQPLLEISHKVSHVNVYLPLGSSEGDYGIRILGPEETILFAASTVARTERGITSLAVDVNLSSARHGVYVLQIRKVGSEWNSYPLRMR